MAPDPLVSSLALSRQYYRYDEEKNIRITFQTPRQLNSEYETRLGRLNISHHFSASFIYDAAWSIALMLNKSIPLLREKNKTLEGMDYGDADGAQMMRDILFRTDFWGMSVC